MNEPRWASVEELLAAQASGELSAATILESTLTRIAEHDGPLNSFVRLDVARARAAAAELDARRRAGGPCGPLAGVPVGLKDNLLTAGLATGCGSRILDGFVPPVDATVVRRLRQADALLPGKCNLDEFAMGSSSETSIHGPVRNPWDTTRVAGGSSGGPAAAVAAGLVPAALGSDTGGSVRQPAALCGVTGLRPTWGRVSRSGLVAFASSLDTVGPLARSVRDCARLLQVIGGPDPDDATCAGAPQPDYLAACARGVEGLVVGLAEESFPPELDPTTARSVRAAVAVLEGLGATVRPVRLPHSRFALATYYLLAPAEASANLARFDGVRFGRRAAGASEIEALYARSRAEGFGPEVVRRILLGTFALSAGWADQYYRKAQAVRTLIRRDFDALFAAGVDLLAGPTAPGPAFPLGAKLDEPLAMYLQDIFTIPASLAGLPALSLPCAPGPDGLPLGLQLVAPPLAESTLCAAGAAYQAATTHHLRRPPGPPAAGAAESR